MGLLGSCLLLQEMAKSFHLFLALLLVTGDSENTNSNVDGEYQTYNKEKLLFCPWIHSIKLQEILKNQESHLEIFIIWDV